MGKHRILIVEDESIVAIHIRRILENLGYEVLPVALSGEESVIAAERYKPDLILMDIKLKGKIDGIEATRKIQRQVAIPVIYLTANADRKTVKRARDTEQYGFLNKPIRESDLQSNIETALYKHRMKRSLAESEEKYRNLIESINEIIFSTDEEGIITFVSSPFERLTGYKPSEVIGRYFAEFFHGDDNHAAVDFFNKQKTGSAGTIELKTIAKSGSSIWIGLSGQPIFTDGQFQGISGVINDITVQKKAEKMIKQQNEELEEANEELQTVIEELEATNEELRVNNEELVQAQDSLLVLDAEKSKILSDLNKRIKELECLYYISEIIDQFDIPLEEILNRILHAICKSWQYPDITCARIIFEDNEFETENFKKTEWSQSTVIRIHERESGSIEVYYLEERLEIAEGPFLKEERKLINSIAVMLGKAIEHRNAVESMLAAHQRFKDIINFLPDATFVVDRDGKVIAWNRAIEEMTGVPEKDMIGKGKYSYTMPFYGKTRPMLIDSVLGVKIDFEDYYESISREGEMIYAENFVPMVYGGNGAYLWIKASPLYDKDGNLIGAIESVRDTTERKQAEYWLRVSEEKFSKIFNSSPIHVNILTLKEGRYIDVNESALEQTGFSREEFIGKTVFDLNIFVNRDEHSEIMNRLLKDNRVFDFEYEFRNKSGEIRTGIINAECIKISKEECVISSTIDITDRKRAERALQESEKKYRTIVESVEESYYEVDLAGNLTFFNDSLCKSLGYPENELMGRNYREYMDESNAKNVFKIFNSLYLTGQTGKGDEWEIIRKDGIRRFYSGTVSLIRDSYGRPEGFRGIVRDITERKRAEEGLKASLREKEFLLKEIHHRVKNNMQVISSLLHLQARYVSDKKVLELFKTSQNRISSIAMVHEKLYRSDSLSEINFKDYISDLIIELLNIYYQYVPNVKISTNVKDICIGIDNAIPCGMIVNELVTNSLKFAFPDGRRGEVKIDFYKYDNSTYLLSISDNGVGFPEGYDFRNTESLGLQLLNALTKQLGGSIELDTSNGVCFTIKFTAGS